MGLHDYAERWVRIVLRDGKVVQRAYVIGWDEYGTPEGPKSFLTIQAEGNVRSVATEEIQTVEELEGRAPSDG